MSRHRTDSDFIMIGFGMALADMIRIHGNEVEARDVMTGHNYQLSDFETAGLDEYDLNELKKAFQL